MTMATWAGGAGPSLLVAARTMPSDLHDFLFFRRERVVHRLDVLVRQGLDLVGPDFLLVLRQVAVPLHALQHVHAVAADVADRDACLLGIARRHLRQLTPPL